MLTKSSDDKANRGYRAIGGTPEEFGRRIRDDIAFQGPIFKSVGVEAP